MTHRVDGLTGPHSASSEQVATIKHTSTDICRRHSQPEASAKRQQHGDGDVYTTLSESIGRIGQNDAEYQGNGSSRSLHTVLNRDQLRYGTGKNHARPCIAHSPGF
jgi:hypothetical protein